MKKYIITVENLIKKNNPNDPIVIVSKTKLKKYSGLFIPNKINDDYENIFNDAYVTGKNTSKMYVSICSTKMGDFFYSICVPITTGNKLCRNIEIGESLLAVSYTFKRNTKSNETNTTKPIINFNT